MNLHLRTSKPECLHTRRKISLNFQGKRIPFLPVVYLCGANMPWSVCGEAGGHLEIINYLTFAHAGKSREVCDPLWFRGQHSLSFLNTYCFPSAPAKFSYLGLSLNGKKKSLPLSLVMGGQSHLSSCHAVSSHCPVSPRIRTNFKHVHSVSQRVSSRIAQQFPTLVAC